MEEWKGETVGEEENKKKYRKRTKTLRKWIFMHLRGKKRRKKI